MLHCTQFYKLWTEDGGPSAWPTSSPSSSSGENWQRKVWSAQLRHQPVLEKGMGGTLLLFLPKKRGDESTAYSLGKSQRKELLRSRDGPLAPQVVRRWAAEVQWLEQTRMRSMNYWEG